jgi:predicted NodU family carbamoyl transferase
VVVVATPRPGLDLDVLIYAGGVALNCTANMALAAVCRDRDAKLLVPPVARTQ